MSYSELLKDPRWQKKRLEILDRDNWFCQACADRESTLHVHHIKYTSNLPWETPNYLLVTLCESCHQKEEYLKDFDYYDLLHDTGLTRKDLVIILKHIRYRMLHPSDPSTPFWILNREIISRLVGFDETNNYVRWLTSGMRREEKQEVPNG